jgi:adenine-specific DNA-methyltransferase
MRVFERASRRPDAQTMKLTDFHSKYYAHELTKRCASDSAEKLAGALVDAQVDLNPHQVEAALFAFRSPLSRGAVLADEVGLGKTIEAGLVLSQKWAERKRKLLVITPANLRKQWYQELQEKFFLPSRILESRSYNDRIRKGQFRPFEPDNCVVLCSYQFARSKASDVAAVDWNLVVIDEAHRLRNVYKPSNVIANVLKGALARAPKLLLTATPLQNSLLELFGLVSFVDEHTFGDLRSFREQFANLSEQEVFDTLKARLRPLCYRTLRKQVLEYVPFTRRHAMVQEFTPEQGEDRLYILVSEYLRRDNLKALPASQRSLMTLVLRKLLASSTFAIAGALDTLIARLRAMLSPKSAATPLEEALDEDYEAFDETAEEWPEEEVAEPPPTEQDRLALEQEVKDLVAFRDLAVSIRHNAKGKALLTALSLAFAQAEKFGAARKAIIFTESRRTQDYLLRLLSDSPHRDGIVLFNGSNTDERSRAIYADWVKANAGTDRVTGSRTADMRSALVDYFRDRGRIMIATEAGAEGINLQFCALVVNYDLPWNPQRIEQRIGRCHRYGQKHDVVVVNFLNRSNAADQRVFQLLAEKFSLFEGVFGASDEVLGTLESGVDFEKRIHDIYQRCRTPDEIAASFDQLQAELTAQIGAALTSTRRKLLEHFDEEVHDKLRVRKDQSESSLNRYERMLMRLTRHELNGAATFDEDESAFTLTANPFPDLDLPVGRYELPRRSGDAHLYRLGHPLAQRLLERTRSKPLSSAEIVFDYLASLPRVAAFQGYRGRVGELLVSRLSVESMDQAEDHLLVAAVTDEGEALDRELAGKFFSLAGAQVIERPRADPDPRLVAEVERQQATILRNISERNARLFEEEAAKLDGWAEDLKIGLEREIKEFDRLLKEARRAATAALTLEEKLAGQRQVRELEGKRNARRKSLFAAQDEIEARRDELIRSVEGKLEQRVGLETLFAVRWRIC